MVLSIFALCVASTPFFVVPLFLLAFAFQYIFSVFRATSRDLKRLESVSRSPVYSSFSEALNGLDTIRAFGCTGRFLKEHRQKMDKYALHTTPASYLLLVHSFADPRLLFV